MKTTEREGIHVRHPGGAWDSLSTLSTIVNGQGFLYCNMTTTDGEDILVHHLEHVGQICRLSHLNYHGHPDFKCESTKRSAHIT